MTKRTRGNPIPLIVEKHPDGYTGYPFITLLQYQDKHLLSIVDNIDKKTVKSFILDLCGPEQVNEELLINIADDWYEHRRDKFPLSFEFSRLGVSEEMNKIYRTFNIEYITRVIGPLPKFEMAEIRSVKRRRKKSIPIGMEVKKRRITSDLTS